MMDKHDLNMNGADAGWCWAVQGHIYFSCRSSDFSSWTSLRKWLFDPEIGLNRSHRVYPAGQKSILVPAFWPHAALRLAGLDIALGFCVRAPIPERYVTFTKEPSTDG